jgi:hypothetical protein
MYLFFLTTTTTRDMAVFAITLPLARERLGGCLMPAQMNSSKAEMMDCEATQPIHGNPHDDPNNGKYAQISQGYKVTNGNMNLSEKANRSKETANSADKSPIVANDKHKSASIDR